VQDRVYFKGGLPHPAGACDQSRIRVLSWNIERGHHPERIAATIAALRPDIACLQEVDWGNERTGNLDILEFLAQRLGMLGLYGIEFLELASPDRSHRLSGGGATGNALLTTMQPGATFRIELPAILDWQNGSNDSALSWRVRRRLRNEPRIGRRCAIAAEFDVRGCKLVVCSLHLEDKHGGVRGRWSQFTVAVQAIEQRTPSVTVVAGDFNTLDCRRSRLVTGDNQSNALGKPAPSIEAAWWKRMLLPELGYVDPFSPAEATFSVPFVFGAKLDWIAVKGGRVLDFGIGSTSPSDHRPLWSDIRIEEIDPSQERARESGSDAPGINTGASREKDSNG
jgi:endonuclease/exonuclease/phosphatase family metal-dependent hydrolase